MRQKTAAAVVLIGAGCTFVHLTDLQRKVKEGFLSLCRTCKRIIMTLDLVRMICMPYDLLDVSEYPEPTHGPLEPATTKTTSSMHYTVKSAKRNL